MAKKKSSNIENNTVTEEKITQQQKSPIIITGWSCVEELAEEIYSSIHSNLLFGNLVYAIRCQEIPRLVITQRNDTRDFMVGQIMPGWTAFYPRVPYSFLFDDILEDMKKLKLNKETIDNYLTIIKFYEDSSN